MRAKLVGASPRMLRLLGGVSRKGPEGVRFELTRPFGLPVFKTGAINRSATPPVVAGCVHAGRGQRPRLQRAIALSLSKTTGLESSTQ
jgi:hypothetical protein